MLEATNDSRTTDTASPWRISSACSSGGCVAVQVTEGTVRVKDTKTGDAQTLLTFDAEEWRAFVAGVKKGEFDI